MATFFGEVVSCSSRAVDEDEDDDLADSPAFNDRSYKIEWELANSVAEENTLRHNCKLLVLGVGPIACGFLKTYLDQPSRLLLKAILHSEQRRDEDVKNVARDAFSLYATANDVAIGLYDNLLNEEESFTACEKIFSRFGAEGLQVVVLTSQHTSTYMSDQTENESPPFLRSIKTGSIMEEASTPLLEQPNIVQGFSAAVMSHCQVHRISACLYVLYADVLDVDSVNMGAFESLLRSPPIAEKMTNLLSTMSHVIKSTRGREKLVDEMNYIYVAHNTNSDGTKQYWKCEIKSCKARVHTRTNDETHTILKRVGEHHHSSTPAKPKIRKTLDDLKAAAVSSRLSTQSLIAVAVANLEEGDMSELPSTSVLSRNIRNWRRSTTCALAIPRKRTGYDIPDEYKFLDTGEPFLQFDSGENDENRLIVFATEKGLNDLEQAPNWAGNGTCKCCPTLLYHLYVLHVQVGTFTIPRLFALLPNKNEETYTRLFTKLLELRPGMSPENLLMDFEKSHMIGFSSNFPLAYVSSCVFHLAQNIYQKVIEIGLKERYLQDSNFNLKVRCFTSLAFLPPSDVIDGFEKLVDDDDLPQELVTYFEMTYIGCERGQGIKRRRIAATFPLHTWNVHERTEKDMPRTNNSVEEYHTALQSSLSCVRMNIWKLISLLKKEECSAQQKKYQFDKGEVNEKKKYKDVNKQI